MNEPLAVDLADDDDDSAHSLAAPASIASRAPASTTAGARWPGEIIRQRRSFRLGMQFAPVAACIATPTVLASILNPDLLHVRSMQIVALLAIGVSIVGVYLLCHGLSRQSHRLRSMKFWFSIAANAVVLIAVASAGVHAYRWGHAPAEAQHSELDE